MSCFIVTYQNTSLIGIPYPDAIKKGIEVLQKKTSKMDSSFQQMIDALDDDEKENKEDNEEEKKHD